MSTTSGKRIGRRQLRGKPLRLREFGNRAKELGVEV